MRDLGSRNGTAIDGRRVRETPARLLSGSRLTLGRLPFHVDAPAIGASSAVPPPIPSVDVRVVEVSADIAGKRRPHSVSIGVGQGEMVVCSARRPRQIDAAQGARRRTADRRRRAYVNGRSMHHNSGRWNWFTSLMGYRGDAYEVGFVQQIDLIQPDLTVREVLDDAGRHMGLPNDLRGSGPSTRRACATWVR